MNTPHRWSRPPQVLLVEDEPDVREAFALTLEDEGLCVLQAGSAEEGLAVLEREQVDLVVTDFSLPGEDGCWMLKEAHRRGVLRGDPIIVTAHSRAATGSGFTVLQKPVELSDFVNAVLSRLGAPFVHETDAATVLFAMDAAVMGRLSTAQRDLSVAIAQRAAREIGHRMQAGLYQRTERGLSVLYRVDRETRSLTVLEVRSASAPE